jgi:cytochrome b561
MIRNNSSGYGLAAIVLHWAIAALFIGQALLGLVMTSIENQRRAFDLIQWHKSFGFLILALLIARIAWRLANPAPDHVATMPEWERKAASLMHVVLYLVLLALTFSGWALVSTSMLGIPTFAFYLFVIPNLPLDASESAGNLWASAHEFLAYTAMALVALHVLAALRHHFLLRDDVLKRMVFPVSRRTR